MSRDTPAQLLQEIVDGINAGNLDAPNVTINLLGTGEYDQRTNQIDLRFTRTCDMGRTRLQANIDLYNVLNANFVATRTGNYGTNGATWLR